MLTYSDLRGSLDRKQVILRVLAMINTTIVETLVIVGGALALLRGLGQLLKPDVSIRDFLIAEIFLLSAAIQVFRFPSLGSGNPILFTIGNLILPFLYLLLGVSLYFLYKFLFCQKNSFIKSDSLHLLPSISYLIFLFLQIVFLPSIPYHQSALSSTLPTAQLLILILSHVILFVYLVFVLWNMRLFDLAKETPPNPYNKTAFIGLIIVSSSLILNVMGMIAQSVLLTSCGHIGFTAALAYWYLANCRYPELEHELENMIRDFSFKGKIAKGINVNLILSRMKELMEKERYFLQDNCSLQELSNVLDIPQHQLSYIIRDNLQINFKTYVNSYRIKEAQTLIAADPECNILSVGFSVGFNSKSSFYEAFKKQLGMTPGEFRAIKRSVDQKSGRQN